jgi:hypothetical protein
MDFASASTYMLQERARKELKHTLVLVSGLRHCFQEAVGELDQPIAVVGQNEIFVLTPGTFRLCRSALGVVWRPISISSPHLRRAGGA